MHRPMTGSIEIPEVIELRFPKEEGDKEDVVIQAKVIKRLDEEETKDSLSS